MLRVCVCVCADWEEAEKLFHTHSVAIHSQPWALFLPCTSSAPGLCQSAGLNLSSSSSSRSSVYVSSLFFSSVSGLLNVGSDLSVCSELSLLCLMSSKSSPGLPNKMLTFADLSLMTRKGCTPLHRVLMGPHASRLWRASHNGTNKPSVSLQSVPLINVTQPNKLVSHL